VDRDRRARHGLVLEVAHLDLQPPAPGDRAIELDVAAAGKEHQLLGRLRRPIVASDAQVEAPLLRDAELHGAVLVGQPAGELPHAVDDPHQHALGHAFGDTIAQLHADAGRAQESDVLAQDLRVPQTDVAAGPRQVAGVGELHDQRERLGDLVELVLAGVVGPRQRDLLAGRVQQPDLHVAYRVAADHVRHGADHEARPGQPGKALDLRGGGDDLRGGRVGSLPALGRLGMRADPALLAVPGLGDVGSGGAGADVAEHQDGRHDREQQRDRGQEQSERSVDGHGPEFSPMAWTTGKPATRQAFAGRGDQVRSAA
jgi:hypothetical protein